jgi:uncharacterized membrane protein HdeD (DUF308 family)
MTIESIEQQTKTAPWWLVLIEGIAAVIVGILLYTSTGTTMVVLVQVLGLYWLIKGIIEIISIFIDSSQWGWKLFGGIVGILAGILILQHPLWSAWLVPGVTVIVIGIFGIIIGLVGLVRAFQGGGWGLGILAVLGTGHPGRVEPPDGHTADRQPAIQRGAVPIRAGCLRLRGRHRGHRDGFPHALGMESGWKLIIRRSTREIKQGKRNDHNNHNSPERKAHA